jgi:hypothetical protein
MKPNKSGNTSLKLLATATLIRRFHERCSPNEIYDKATRCYETLIEMIQTPETARDISALLNIPADTIKYYAGAIIDSLLFNTKNDPYLSFGLNRDARLSEVSRRWKSLIVLYHPDKYLNQKIFEEKAKKINELYEEIRKLEKNKINYNSFNNAAKLSSPSSRRILHSVYFKYLPLIIIGAAMIIAIVSILLLIFNNIFASYSISSHGATVIGVSSYPNSS